MFKNKPRNAHGHAVRWCGCQGGKGDWGLKQYSVHSSSCPQNIQETDNCGNQASSSSSSSASAVVLVLLAAKAWIIQHLPYLAVPAAKQSGKPTHKRWGWCHGRGYYENDICPGRRERVGGGGGGRTEWGGGGRGEESTGYWIAAFGTLLQPFPLGFQFCHTPTQPRFIMGDRKQPSDIF